MEGTFAEVFEKKKQKRKRDSIPGSFQITLCPLGLNEEVRSSENTGGHLEDTGEPAHEQS